MLGEHFCLWELARLCRLSVSNRSGPFIKDQLKFPYAVVASIENKLPDGEARVFMKTVLRTYCVEGVIDIRLNSIDVPIHRAVTK